MWFTNLLLALVLALAPEQSAPGAWDYTTVRADMFAGLAVLELQQSYFQTLGDHPKGELLFGLADATRGLATSG